jgi:hypothetical protein
MSIIRDEDDLTLATGLAAAASLAVLLVVFTGGCAVPPPPVVRPQPGPAPAASWRAVGLIVRGVAGASCSLQDVPGWTPPAVTNADGYLAWLTVTGGLRRTAIRCHAEGYVDYEAPAVLATDEDEDLPAITLHAEHVDPSGIPLEQLAAIRGAMWPLGTASTCGAVPLGPRPGQADNVIATDFITDYPPEVQACIVAELKARGYTHVVMGPLVDSDGYHGIWPPNDWRGANFDRFLDALQMFWDAGLAPVVFIHPDGWTFEQTRDELTPLLATPRARRLLRIVVPHGWEPCKYECSSWTWAAYGQWARTTLPAALVLLHTVCDVDAPVGTDSRGDDNGTGNATGWARVVPFYHGWLTQSCAFEHPDAHGDPNHPDKTNFDNWADLFNPNVRGSYRDRFEHGYAGWPTSSAWGAGKPLLVFAGEYSSYWRFWQHRTEAEGVAWGNRAIASGAAGYLDGGSVPVRR